MCFQSFFLAAFGSFLESFWNPFSIIFQWKNASGKLGKNVRNTWGKSKENLGEIQEIHIKPKENPGTHPGKMQGKSRENLREIQGNSKEARGTSPRKIQRKQGRPPGKRVASVARERAQRASERSKWSSNRFKQTGSKIDFHLI